jgi:hypothetical protein
MSEPENFLSRWSRRKLKAEQAADPSARPRDPSAEALAKAEGGDPEPHDETTQSEALDSRLRGNERITDSTGNVASEKEPVFDLSTLPSLESITAETDIRMFLQKGVPAELTRAALRRAWASDPAIRDFIEIAENQWDFATGSDLPGFGPLNTSPEELRRMVADLFEAGPKATSATEADTAVADSGPETLESPQVPTAAENPEQAGRQAVTTVSQDQSAEGTAPAGSPASIVHSSRVNVAAQQNSTDEEYKPLPIRRSHGGALPR